MNTDMKCRMNIVEFGLACQLTLPKTVIDLSAIFCIQRTLFLAKILESGVSKILRFIRRKLFST